MDVAQEGVQIARDGVPYVVEGLIPAYGMLGMLVAYAKVGKTSFAQALGAAVATGSRFLERSTERRRVLMIAAEDPPEYTAYLARHQIDLPRGWLTYYRHSILLNAAGLAAIATTVSEGDYGLVLIASWQAVVRGLVKDENDNAGAVQVMEGVKACTRDTKIPWLIDAHSGKGEDQRDDADPSHAMRGASGAAGACDYTLSLRYDGTPFGTRRRLSGKGRFVNFEPLVLDSDLTMGTYTVLGTTKTAVVETTWRMICATAALTATPQSAGEIAVAAGLKCGANGKATAASRKQIAQALYQRDGVTTTTERRNGQQTTVYSQVPA